MQLLQGKEWYGAVPNFHQEALHGANGQLNFHPICLQGGSENQCSTFAEVVSVKPREELDMLPLHMGTAY